MDNENGCYNGTPLFYKWVVGVFTMLFVAGIFGVYETNIKLAKIEVEIENLQSIFADRFTSIQGSELTNRVVANEVDVKLIAEKLNEHILWAAKQEQWLKGK